MVAKYFWNVLLGLDQFLNTLIGGDPDETISSRAGKQVETSRVAYCLCRILHVFDKDHCNKSIEPDEGSNSALKQLLGTTRTL